jgi:hypothetical protein
MTSSSAYGVTRTWRLKTTAANVAAKVARIRRERPEESFTSSVYTWELGHRDGSRRRVRLPRCRRGRHYRVARRGHHAIEDALLPYGGGVRAQYLPPGRILELDGRITRTGATTDPTTED